MISILVIEDEDAVRDLIVEELQDAGFKIFQASNGREGLEMMLAHWPDIVISDISMPEMDGRELLAEIQVNYPDLAVTPFIFLTALADKETMLEGLRAGADDYLTKPVDFDILMAKVEGCVKRVEAANKTGRSF